MNANVFLPRLLAVRIVGASPVFKRNIEREVHPGINMVLGGNGIGKTTTMQAVTFGLTGGISKEIEPDKSFRWNHKWFAGRILGDKASGAYVEIEFALGDRVLGIRRSFASAGIMAVKTAASNEWVQERARADEIYAEALDQAGYRSPFDFAFLVHRLLYLAEDRRMLAWDADAQARLLMLLSPDAVDEHAFREQRAELKQTDSKRRHTHVYVNKVVEALEEKGTPVAVTPRSSKTRTNGPKSSPSLDAQLNRAVAELEALSGRRRRFEKDFDKLDESLSFQSNEIEVLREKIDAVEVSFIQSSLKEVEAESSLPLAKLLVTVHRMGLVEEESCVT